MIRCLIVDDETLAQQVIQNHLQKMPGFRVAAVCRNSEEAARALKTLEVDLIFLDIQLPGVTGLHFLKTLRDPPLVIITTAYAEYALESYEFSVIDYLLKPISFERFQKALAKITAGKLVPNPVAEKASTPADHLFIKSGSKFFKVDLSEIVYIEAMKDYLKIHTQEYNLVTLQTMGEMEVALPDRQFLRVHKSFIIAVSHIKSVYGNTIELGKTNIPIGLSYKNALMNFIARR